MTPDRVQRAQSADDIEGLKKTIETLRSRVEELEAERERLLKKNRALRREMTQSRLLSQLEEPVDSHASTDKEAPSRAEQTTEQLYHLLPPSFTFSEFFQLATSEGFDTEEARRCLRVYFSKSLIDQKGSRLTKKRDSFGKTS